jgi:hypothetical protein
MEGSAATFDAAGVTQRSGVEAAARCSTLPATSGYWNVSRSFLQRGMEMHASLPLLRNNVMAIRFPQLDRARYILERIDAIDAAMSHNSTTPKVC